MTGNEAVQIALQLLNYTNQTGQVDNANSQEFFGRARVIVNQIYADLWKMGHQRGTFVPLDDLNETLPLSEDVCRNALVYGVAMLFAQSAGDADNQTLYASLYNRNCTIAADGPGIVDVWPRGCDW
ncbi:MAG: hypothetical protein J6K98_02535 [Clostridia bacterium]|nr:hypothetical protein [Clostridia bacterium]